MNDKTSGNGDLRRLGAVAVVSLVAVLATACASSTTATVSSAGASTPTYAQAVAFAQCIRGHGVPSFPNPDASGKFNISQSTLDSGQAQTAYGACRHLLPNGGPNLSQLEQQAQQRQQEELPALLKWEQCVRGHGEPDFSIGLGGQSPAAGNKPSFNPNTPQFQAALNACHYLLPPGVSVSVGTSRSTS